jgi:hypothetical protein
MTATLKEIDTFIAEVEALPANQRAISRPVLIDAMYSLGGVKATMTIDDPEVILLQGGWNVVPFGISRDTKGIADTISTTNDGFLVKNAGGGDYSLVANLTFSADVDDDYDIRLQKMDDQGSISMTLFRETVPVVAGERNVVVLQGLFKGCVAGDKLQLAIRKQPIAGASVTISAGQFSAVR